MRKIIFSAIFGRARQPITEATHRETEALPISITKSDGARMRGPLRDVDLVLSIAAETWLIALPRPLRPAALCLSYPRVVNRLALCWRDPVLTEQLLDDLLDGRRGNRKGFPAPIVEELLRLRRLHELVRD